MHTLKKWNISKHFKLIFCKYLSISVWIWSSFENWIPLHNVVCNVCSPGTTHLPPGPFSANTVHSHLWQGILQNAPSSCPSHLHIPSTSLCTMLLLLIIHHVDLKKQLPMHWCSVQKPNSWTYNFFEVSGHNLESSHTWGFCMDFLNHREGDMVFYQVFLLSPLQCTVN